MALKGILGYDGVTPVMSPHGTKPVLMESPCPYEQWEIDGYDLLDNMTLTHGSYGGNTFWVRGDQIVEQQGTIVIGLRLKMVSPGAGKSIRATLTYGGGDDDTSYYALMVTNCPLFFTSDGYELGNYAPLGETVDIPEPYYRYIIGVTFSIVDVIGPVGWMRIDFEFVDA